MEIIFRSKYEKGDRIKSASSVRHAGGGIANKCLIAQLHSVSPYLSRAVMSSALKATWPAAASKVRASYRPSSSLNSSLSRVRFSSCLQSLTEYA